MDPVTETVGETRDADQAAETGLTGVRWLSARERRAWLTMVATHMQLMPTLEADLQLEGTVSFFEYQVLAMLSESEDALAMSELAARTNSSLSRLSHVARKLESRGLMARSPSSEDARVTMAEITAEGMAEIVRLAPFHVASVRARFLDSLDEQDLADIGRIGAKIIAHLDPEHWVFRDPALADDQPRRA